VDHHGIPFLERMKRVPQSKLSSRTLLQHLPIHSCGCCYALGRPVAGFKGGNYWKTLEKKQHRPRQTNRQTGRQTVAAAGVAY